LVRKPRLDRTEVVPDAGRASVDAEIVVVEFLVQGLREVVGDVEAPALRPLLVEPRVEIDGGGHVAGSRGGIELENRDVAVVLGAGAEFDGERSLLAALARYGLRRHQKGRRDHW
jgi:hypothetical protein